MKPGCPYRFMLTEKGAVQLGARQAATRPTGLYVRVGGRLVQAASICTSPSVGAGGLPARAGVQLGAHPASQPMNFPINI